jgi:hypothetical protein
MPASIFLLQCRIKFCVLALLTLVIDNDENTLWSQKVADELLEIAMNSIFRISVPLRSFICVNWGVIEACARHKSQS